MSRASSLFRLQEIDLELDAGHARLAAIDQALSNDPEVQSAKQAALKAHDQFNATRVRARAIEVDVQALSEKIADAEQRLYSGAISNPKELRDLEQDLASLRRRRSEVEEKELDAMIAAETAEGEAATCQTRLQQAEQASLRAQGALTEERTRLQARVSQITGEREAISDPLPNDDRLVYQRLWQTKNHRPVAKVADSSCLACGEEVSSARVQEIRRGTALVRCSGCERILYAE
jgi:predicted  nucleic acid-binding Zn-ribbon protein